MELLSQAQDARGLTAACIVVIGGIAVAGILYYLLYGRK